MKREFIRLRGFLLSILLAIPAYPVSAGDSNEILLKSRHFTPQRGITADAKATIEAIPERAHVLIQLERKPTIEDTNHLESKGVKLFSYIPNKAWFASIPSDKISELTAISYVRSITEILPEDKISPHIKSGDIFEPSVKDGKTIFIIEFFEDVPAIEIEETIARHNGLITGWVPILNAVVAILQVEEGIAPAWLTSSGQPDYNPVCDISVPGGNKIINEYDLARFCEDWLWREVGETSMSFGFSELLYAAPPTQQPQTELQSEPEPQPQVQSAPEPPQPEPELQSDPNLQTEPQPQLTEEDIQELVDLLEELWLTNEELRSTITEADWLELIETIRQIPVE